jgi:hypothetical protein
MYRQASRTVEYSSLHSEKEIEEEQKVSVPLYMKNIENVEFPEDYDDDDSDYVGHVNDNNSMNSEDCSSISENSGDDLEMQGIVSEIKNNKTQLDAIYSHDQLTNSVKLAKERKVKGISPSKSRSLNSFEKNSSRWIAVRIEEFPNNALSEISNKLYCNCCNKFIALKKDIIKNHVEGIRHKQYLVKQQERYNLQQTIHKYINSNFDVKGVKADLLVYRIEVCRAFLVDGLPFHLLEDGKKNSRIRELLERGRSCVGRREVSQLIPLVLQMEMETVAKECNKRNISFSFDGTTDVAEVVNIVIRFVTDGSKITQRLLVLKLLSKSPDASELARFLHSTLLQDNKLRVENIHAAMRDGAPVNGAALSKLEVIFPFCVFPICLSHSINVVGCELKKSAELRENLLVYGQ